MCILRPTVGRTQSRVGGARSGPRRLQIRVPIQLFLVEPL